MMTMHQRSINMSREELIKGLKAGLATHRAQYSEAMADYRIKIARDLSAAVGVATRGDVEQLAALRVQFSPPQSHEKEYVNLIELMEFSVDENVNVDSDSFRAYIKNEWPWSKSFQETMLSNKMAIGAVGSMQA